MQLQEVKCFGVRAGEGNAALVVQGGPRDQAGRQAFANGQNVSACVFLDDDGDPRAACVLDFYYPHTRSPLCLHATLAAARILFTQQWSYSPIVVRTALRSQYLTLSREGEELFVELRRQPVDAPAPPLDLVAEMLAATAMAFESPPAAASVGSPKLLVEVKDSAALQALRPDLARIVAWGKEAGVNGVYAYCRVSDGVYEGRNFNHLDPAMEDSATGVAAGALTVLLGRALTLYQGSRTCRIQTRLDGDTIFIGGRASGV
jgi:PhzF family phenazine biosynthesis protein